MDSGCITEHSEPPFCVNHLTVAKGKKLRLVVDLRHVNCHLFRFKFKYEDLRSLAQVLQEGHWFYAWNVKSGYHHVDSISPDRQKYLGFAWPFNGVLGYFTFADLPFGLNNACFCFTKLFRPLVKRWRSMGHNFFVYLDNGFGSQPERTSAIAAAFIQRKDLVPSSLLINKEKSHRDVTDSVLNLIWHILSLIWHALSLIWPILSLIWHALSLNWDTLSLI